MHFDTVKYNKANPCYVLAKSPFDLVYCDVWGPYHVSSHSRYLHGFSCLNRNKMLALLYQDFVTGTVIPRFCNMIDTQFNAKIKVFRLDNAPKLKLIH